ncbi:MAG TPA: FISUMP domain-containing protein [Bacteroidales bacterium]|nr:FISUMP domain-containing protein [Bacteroidales bacterium]
MRKFYFIIFFIVCTTLSLVAQTTELRFTAKDRNHLHVRLDKVQIVNYTQSWMELIFYPDTVLILTTGTGITTLDEASTSFSSVMPNPSYGISDINVQTVKEEFVQLSLFDVQGKKITELQQLLTVGKHTLRVHLSTPQLYLLTLTMEDIQHTFKIINISSGGQDKIEYRLANSEYPMVYGGGRGKGNSDKPFNIGDNMGYYGYKTVNGVEYTSIPVEQAQNGSEDFTLLFDAVLVTLPTVTTDTISNITDTEARGGGNVTDDGNSPVTLRGICWNTSPNPTTNDNLSGEENGLGTFTCDITGLTLGTTYYVRAFAINSLGTAYGNEVSFTTLGLPTVTTNAISGVTPTGAISGGNVTSDGNSPVTARGICWNTSPNPTLADNVTNNGSGLGSFTSNISGLTPSTTYYVRAYATNSVGTAYGNAISFTTSAPPCNPVTDIDGNTYLVLQLGSQCWMRENLRVTRYANGTNITLSATPSTNTAYRMNPNNNASNVSTYGYLYNWAAVMNGASSSDSNPSGVQGICPDGWHLPSKREWEQLKNYLVSQSSYHCNFNNEYLGKSLASTTGWNSSSTTCAVGNNPSSNNSTGFSAPPAGSFYDFGYPHVGNYSFFWLTTQHQNPQQSYVFHVRYDSPNATTGYMEWKGGYSVRCVRN